MFSFNYVIKLKFDDKMYKMIDFFLVIWVFNVDYIIFVYGKFIYLIIVFFFGILIVLD